ncbi:hypothetical protein [Aquabacterium sp.]|uniref:hypothetical protein n=1 Tax=Aquabacterium sp. TaxID=1872578 RepID=UPI003784A345
MTTATSTCVDGGADAATKAFATLQARLALAGFTLERTDRGVLIVSRGLRHRELGSLAEAEQFAKQVGAS